MSFEEHIMSKDNYTIIFLRKMEGIVFLILNTFCNARETMVRTAYFREMFSFECSLLRLYEQKNISLFL